MKVCARCKKEKSLEAFVSGRNFCKDCHNARMREWRATEAGKASVRISNQKIYYKFDGDEQVKPLKEQEQLASEGSKRCSRCKEDKLLDEFYKDRSQADGRNSYCKDCTKETQRERRAKNPDYTTKQRERYANRGQRSERKLLKEEKRAQAQLLFENDLKICARCQEEKPLSSFNKDQRQRDGFDKYCRDCHRQIQKQWQDEHPDAVQASQKDYYHKNKAKRLAAWNGWARSNPDKRVEHNRKYARPSQRRRIKRDGFYRALCRFRTHFLRAMKSKKGGRRMFVMLGYTKEDLKQHLEARFVDGMSWDNFGKEWHVDHIRPIASFDFEEPDAYRQCWALENLQPLWQPDNSTKSSIWNGKLWQKGKAIKNAMVQSDPQTSP